MGSERLWPLFASAALVLCGIAGAFAWGHGLWGLLTGAILTAIWIAALNMVERRRGAIDTLGPASRPSGAEEEVVLRALIDVAPTPLLLVEASRIRALNRAARRLFFSDDLILPAPEALLDPASHYLRHEGRSWRIDRVIAETRPSRIVSALVDIEQEERAAEARAARELIQIMGHELLNGLAPIASLAESALAASEAEAADPALLTEILGTLARRADGLQRFASAYRALARLPEPVPRKVRLAELARDLARLFEGRWPDAVLAVDVQGDPAGSIDRDQISQALWALLQNGAEAGEGRGKVTLGMSRRGSALEIAVADDGPGIAAQRARLIFQPFHSTKPEGSGIGLSLARQIALAHGGDLVLQGGAGNRFLLTLPMSNDSDGA